MFTGRLMAQVPDILERHYERIRAIGEPHREFVERNRDIIDAALGDMIDKHIHALEFPQMKYEAFLRETAMAGFEDGKRVMELGGHNVTAMMEMSKDVYICAFHGLFEPIEDWVEDRHKRRVYFGRLLEMSWVRFLGFMEGYLTQQNQLIDALHVQKMAVIGQMAAGMAHEIRNPLTVIKGFLQLIERKLERSDVSPQDMIRYARLCMEEINAIERQVSDYLILARKNHDSGQCTNAVSIPGVFGRVFEIMKHDFADKRIEFVFRSGPKSEELLGVEEHVEQIFLNLLKNAADAMPDGGELSVAAIEEAGRISIRITDQGVGMEEEVLRHAFDPFYSTKTDGTGLGLTICRQLVEDLQGTIRLYSAPSLGTTVFLTFAKSL